MTVSRSEYVAIKRGISRLSARVKRLERLLESKSPKNVSEATAKETDENKYSFAQVIDEYLNGKEGADV